MTEKLNFDRFYSKLEMVRVSSDEPRHRSRAHYQLYQHYSYWGMLAINEYLHDSDLEDLDTRGNMDCWSSLEDERGVSIGLWTAATISGNRDYHKIYDSIEYDIDRQILLDDDLTILANAVADLLYEYDVPECYIDAFDAYDLSRFLPI